MSELPIKASASLQSERRNASSINSKIREAVIRACAYATANCLQWTPKVDPADVKRIVDEIELTTL